MPIHLFWLTVLLVLLAASYPHAQSNTRLAGTVTSDHGAPVAGAELILGGGAFRTLTDAAGRFRFENVPPGQYRLGASAIGYEPAAPITVEIVTDVTRWIELVLKQRVYPVTDVTVTDHRPQPDDGVVVLGRTQIDSLKPGSTAELLESLEGVVVDLTGPSGQAQVRVRGSAPRQVLVLLDGQRINSPADGSADLNSVPVAIVERVELHKNGSSASFGPDALAGTINIVTQPSAPSAATSLEFETDRSRWGTRRRQVVAVDPVRLKALSTRFAYIESTSDGNFDFTYHISPGDSSITGRRLNNRSNRQSYFAGGQWRPGRTVIGYSVHSFRSTHGLPGPASQQNADGYRDDDRFMVNFRIEQKPADRLSVLSSVGYARLAQLFKDRSGPPGEQFDVEYVDDRRDARLSAEWLPIGLHTLELGGEYRRERLDHTDHLREINSIGRSYRRTSSVFIDSRHPFNLSRTRVLDDITATSSLRYDHAITSPEDSTPRYPWEPPRRTVATESWSPHVGLSAARGERLRFVTRVGWGKSLQLPSINALFWQGDARAEGNPDLRPERSESLEGGFECQGRIRGYTLAAGMTLYRREVHDLIVWVQTGLQGVFKPVNLEAARVTGHEDFVSLSAFDGLVSVRYGNSVTHARNRQPGHNSYDKWLTYTPAYVTTFSLRLEKFGLTAGYSGRWVGRRYALPGNERWYDAYSLHDLSLGARLQLAARWLVQLDGRVRNLTDEEYVLIGQYPMPGRDFDVALKISFTLKETSP